MWLRLPGEDWDKYGFEDYYLRLAMFQAELTEEGEPVIKENYPSQILIVGNPVEGSDDRYAILYSMHDDSGKLLESVDLKSLKVYTISSASVNLLRTDARYQQPQLCNAAYRQYEQH